MDGGLDQDPSIVEVVDLLVGQNWYVCGLPAGPDEQTVGDQAVDDSLCRRARNVVASPTPTSETWNPGGILR